MSEKLTDKEKANAYSDAYKIAKEAARGGHGQPGLVLKQVYEVIKEAYLDVKSTD